MEISRERRSGRGNSFRGVFVGHAADVLPKIEVRIDGGIGIAILKGGTILS